jgi:mRNA interferase MazF
MVRRGEVYWVDFGDGVGSEQSGVRPALVIQNDVGNALSPTTIVATITSRVMRKRYPFHVPLDECILPKTGTVLCEQLRTVDTRRVTGEPIAHLSPELMAEVGQALRRSLGI